MRISRAALKRMTLGELATRIPYATKVLTKYRLDFCCRGSEPLGKACKAAGKNEDEVADELKSLMRSKEEEHWAAMSHKEIAGEIVDKYHAELREFLPQILRFAKAVERSHASHEKCPKGLSLLLEEFWCDMEAHMEEEEKWLFPLILSAKFRDAPIESVMREHLRQGHVLKEIRRICRDFALPEGACKTWRALYGSLETLEQELMEHIHLENNVLFERALA